MKNVSIRLSASCRNDTKMCSEFLVILMRIYGNSKQKLNREKGVIRFSVSCWNENVSGTILHREAKKKIVC